MVELPLLTITSRREWRAWLSKHHATSQGVWLVCYKGHTGRPSISGDDVLREALCFGWIDSLIKRLDEDRYARKVTPRKPTSKWSDVNRRLWAELKEAGLLAAPGLAAAPTATRYAAKPKIPELPGYIEKAFKANPAAWKFFQQLAPSYRRHFVAWIHIAKQPETRERRIKEAVALLGAGKKLGLK
jgi:uncharacterized protein YdeI (YjbR/CyaY-like superfamily)